MLKTVLLIIAVSGDGFAAAVGTGAAGVRIPLRSAVIISFTGTLFLTVSAAFGDVIVRFVPERFCTLLSFILLFSLGVLDLFGSFFEKLARKHGKSSAVMFFDGSAADKDGSKTISPKEAAALSAALSVDSLVTGVSAGLGRTYLPALAAGTFIAGLASVELGQLLGRRIVSSVKPDMSWLSGAILILLAFLNIR